jgi:hypothetical protein
MMMYFTSDSMLPENQRPFVMTVAPWGHRACQDNI